MTDIRELVKEAREAAHYADEYAGERELWTRVADALEAQAKEIKTCQQTELTYITRVADMQREYSAMQAKLKARIAEQDYVLEMIWRAEDRAARAWQAKTGEHLTWPDQAKLVEWLMDELHAARAALNGEKK